MARTGTSSTAAAQDRERRRAREARPEQGRHGSQRGERVAPLASDEPIGLDGVVDGGVILDIDRLVEGTRRRREADRELERGRDAIAQAALDVHGQRRFAERRAGPDER